MIKKLAIVSNSVKSNFHRRKLHSLRKTYFNHEEWEQITHLKGLPIVHHKDYVCPLPPKHRFQMRKFEALFSILIDESVIDKKQVIKPNPINAEDCCAVHESDYVQKFFEGKITAKEQRVTGFQWTEGLVRRVRYETGGTLLASKLCLNRGLACSTGGGTHHAFPDHGSGFCLINDLAVTAKSLINYRLAEKVLIVDLDVHQGDGTAYIFRDTPEVFTLSLHCRTNFPLKKMSSDLDVEIEAHTGDGQYLSTLEDVLPSVIDEFRPDIVLYDAGVDPHVDDLLGKLDLSSEGLYKRDLFVLRASLSRGVPVASVIGGGYDHLDKLAPRHTIIHRAASVAWEKYL